MNIVDWRNLVEMFICCDSILFIQSHFVSMQYYFFATMIHGCKGYSPFSTVTVGCKEVTFMFVFLINEQPLNGNILPIFGEIIN